MSNDSEESRLSDVVRHDENIPYQFHPDGAELLGNTWHVGWRCHFEKFFDKLPAARRFIGSFVDEDEIRQALKLQLLFKSSALCWFRLRYSRFTILQDRVTMQMEWHIREIKRLQKIYDEMYDWAAIVYHRSVPHDLYFSHWIRYWEPDILWVHEQPHWFHRDLAWRTRDPRRVLANWILLSSFILVFRNG